MNCTSVLIEGIRNGLPEFDRLVSTKGEKVLEESLKSKTNKMNAGNRANLAFEEKIK